MRPSTNPSTATATDDFTPVLSRHSRHAHSSSQHTKRNRLPPQDEHKQQRSSFDDKPIPPPLPPATTAFSAHSPASSRRSSRASNPRKSSFDEMDDDGDWDSGLTYEEKHNEGSNSGSSRRQRLQSNADEYEGANEYDEYDDALPSDDSEAAECPLCMEQLDPTDLAFHPCKCGYQVCLYCLTGDHMVLTRSGWQSIKCIADGEFVASYNIDTQAMEWKEAQGGTLCYDASASGQHQLFRMESSGMDVVATRDHRMLVAQLNSGYALQKRRPFGYSTVEELLKMTYTQGAESAEGVMNSSLARSMSRAVLRSGLNTAEGFKFTIPGLEAVCDWWWARDKQLGFLRFVGFWLGDGHLVLERHTAYVCITQRKPEPTEWLMQLLDEVFPHWWFANQGPVDAKGTTWNFHIRSCPPLVDWLREMAAGPQGYNPVDPAAMRNYPHFTYDPGLASAEAESRYRHPAAVGAWTQAEMLAAMTAPVLLPPALPVVQAPPLPPVVPSPGNVPGSALYPLPLPLPPLTADGGEVKTMAERRPRAAGASVTAATGEREYYVPSGEWCWRSEVWQSMRYIRGDDAHAHCMRCGSDLNRDSTGTSNLLRHLRSELCRQGSELTKDEQLEAALARQRRKRPLYLPAASELSNRASCSGESSRSRKSPKTDNFYIPGPARRQRSLSVPDMSAAVASVAEMEATESEGLDGDMPLLVEVVDNDGHVARIPFAAGQVRWFYRPGVNLPVSSVSSSAATLPPAALSSPLPVSPATSAKEEAVSPSPRRQRAAGRSSLAPPASSSTPSTLWSSSTRRRSRSSGVADLRLCGGVRGGDSCDTAAGSAMSLEVGLYQPTVSVAPVSLVVAPLALPAQVPIPGAVPNPAPPAPAAPPAPPAPAAPPAVPVPLLPPVLWRPGLPPRVPNPNNVPIPPGGALVPWNNGWWIIINGHWFYLKRWLGAAVAATFSHMSQKQAVALLEGLNRADGRYASVQFDEQGEPTGTWYCSNSSFPLIHHLMLIGQLAGAMVDLMRTAEAGTMSIIDGREVRSTVDHWLLSIHFSPPPRTAPVHTVYLAKPEPADDIEKRGYWQYQDDGNVYCITVKDNGNFLTQRLSLQRLRAGNGAVDVRAQAVFVGNCYNNILDNLNGQCPACRREYDRSLASTASLAQLTQPTLIQQTAAERKDKKRLREREKRKASQHDRNTVSQQQQAQLASVRIIQRNLVYICGLPAGAAYEDWLRKREYFGRFGKITKASVTKRSGGSHDAVNAAPSSSASQRSSSGGVYSAYVTYKTPSSAAACIAAMHLSTVMGSTIRCTYGTTKYCAFFVRGQPCTNTACLYLHELAKPEDCVGKDELTEERLGQSSQQQQQQADKLERQSSASSQHSVGAQSSAASVGGSSSIVTLAPTQAPGLSSTQPTVVPSAPTSSTASPRPSSAGSSGSPSASSCSSLSSSTSASSAAMPAASSILSSPLSSPSSQLFNSFPFPAPAPTRSVSEGWAAVAAAGAAASQCHSVDADDVSSLSSSCISSVPTSLTATAPLPPPTWAAVPSTTSAAALLSQAIQAEKEREHAESREQRQPSAPHPLSTAAAEPPYQPSHTTGSIIRRPPPGFEKMAGWSSSNQPASASPPPSAPSDDSSFFSMFAFPPPVASAARSSLHSLPPTAFSPSIHDQTTFRSIAQSPLNATATEAAGPTWDFNAFVEQLRATTSNLQPMPFVAADDASAFTAASQHRDALQSVLFPSADTSNTGAASGVDSAMRQLRPSGSAALSSGSLLDPPLFPAPLSSVTLQLSELSAFSSLLNGGPVAASASSLSLLSSDVGGGGGLSATDTDDDWSARADRVDGFDVSFAVSSPRAPYKPSGFDDSPPLTALASLRHSLPPPPLALDTANNASTTATAPPPFVNNGMPPTIRILTPTEPLDLAGAEQQQRDNGERMNGDDGRRDLAAHVNSGNGRHRKGSERGERRTSNRDNGRRNHGSPIVDGNGATGRRAPVLSLTSPQSKHSSSSCDAEVSTAAPAAPPVLSTSSPILQLKRTPSSADKKTSPASPATPSPTNVADERSVDSNGSSGSPDTTAQTAAPVALASPKPILSLAPRRNGQLVRNVNEPQAQLVSQAQPQPVRILPPATADTNGDSTDLTSAVAPAAADSDRSIALVGLRPHGRSTLSRAQNGRQHRAHGESNNSSGPASPVQRSAATPGASAFTSPPLVRLSLSKGLSSLSLGTADSHAHSTDQPPLIAPSHSPHIVDRPAAVFEAITPPSNVHISALGNSPQQHTTGRHGGGNRDRGERQPRGRDRDRYRVRDEHGEADGPRDRRVQSSLLKR